MTNELTRYEPPSLREMLAAGLDPVDVLAANGWGDGAAEHLVDLLTMLDGEDAERADRLRVDLAWMLEHQETGVAHLFHGVDDAVGGIVADAPAGVLQRLTIGQLWTVELLEDHALLEAVLAAAGPEVRARYDEIMREVDEPNPDGLSCWGDLTAEERRRVKTFTEALLASRGN